MLFFKISYDDFMIFTYNKVMVTNLWRLYDIHKICPISGPVS